MSKQKNREKKFLGRKRQKSAKGRENREGRGGMDRKASGSVLAANAVITNMAAGWARGRAGPHWVREKLEADDWLLGNF